MYYIVSESVASNYVSEPYNTVEAAEHALNMLIHSADRPVDPTYCVILSSQQLISSLIIERDWYKNMRAS